MYIYIYVCISWLFRLYLGGNITNTHARKHNAISTHMHASPQRARNELREMTRWWFSCTTKKTSIVSWSCALHCQHTHHSPEEEEDNIRRRYTEYRVSCPCPMSSCTTIDNVPHSRANAEHAEWRRAETARNTTTHTTRASCVACVLACILLRLAFACLPGCLCCVWFASVHVKHVMVQQHIVTPPDFAPVALGTLHWARRQNRNPTTTATRPRLSCMSAYRVSAHVNANTTSVANYEKISRCRGRETSSIVANSLEALRWRCPASTIPNGLVRMRMRIYALTSSPTHEQYTLIIFVVRPFRRGSQNSFNLRARAYHFYTFDTVSCFVFVS